ncbi:Ctf13 [Kluyveromyces lactis]|nr:Ctf13 [Kluyveromyces lactis]
MFDTELFLSLPIDIRFTVYFFLGDVVQNVRPPAKSDIFNDELIAYPNIREFNQSLVDKYSKHIGIYDYIPNFIPNWCRDFDLLRHDIILADRLQVGLQYEEQWFSVQWIVVSGELEIGIFTADEQFLQVSYTINEYCRVLSITQQDLRLGINVSDINDVNELCKEIQHRWLFDTVSYISFINCWDLDHENVVSIISYMESFNNLHMLRIESKNMFNNLINTQGVRENPGKTIIYNVRQNIFQLELYTLRNLGYKSVVDLQKWEQLQCLSISGCEFIDLNNLILPQHCKMLILTEVKYVIWWDLSHLLKRIRPQWIIDDQVKKPTKKDEAEESEWYNLYLEVVQTYQPLNFIEMHNTKRVKGNLILPARLVTESRIKISNGTKVDSVLLI